MDCDINDMFKEVVAALYDIGFSKQEQDDVFALLAGILHLGNLAFSAKVSAHSGGLKRRERCVMRK